MLDKTCGTYSSKSIKGVSKYVEKWVGMGVGSLGWAPSIQIWGGRLMTGFFYKLIWPKNWLITFARGLAYDRYWLVICVFS